MRSLWNSLCPAWAPRPPPSTARVLFPNPDDSRDSSARHPSRSQCFAAYGVTLKPLAWCNLTVYLWVVYSMQAQCSSPSPYRLTHFSRIWVEEGWSLVSLTRSHCQLLVHGQLAPNCSLCTTLGRPLWPLGTAAVLSVASSPDMSAAYYPLHWRHTNTKLLCITDFSWRFGWYHLCIQHRQNRKGGSSHNSLLGVLYTPWVSTHLFAFQIRAKSPHLSSSRIPKSSTHSSAGLLPLNKILKMLVTLWCSWSYSRLQGF